MAKGSRRYRSKTGGGGERAAPPRTPFSPSAHALPFQIRYVTDVTAGNGSVMTWAAPPVMKHGSGGIR